MDEQRRTRGAILVMAALFITAACGFAALAVDAGYLWTEHSMLQNAADAAALAGASELPGNWGQATALATNYIERNLVFGNVATLQEINPGHWDKGVFTPTAPDDADAMRVIVGRTENLFFGPVIGVPTAPVKAWATATRTPGDANISLVLDNSGSMRPSMQNLIRAGMTFVSTLANSQGRHTVGLTTFSEDVVLNSPVTLDFTSVINQLSTMQPQSGTNIAGGLKTGRLDAFQRGNPIPNVRDVLILLSDGRANWPDPATAQALAEQEASLFKNNNDPNRLLITISLFGNDPEGPDPDSMDRMASQGPPPGSPPGTPAPGPHCRAHDTTLKGQTKDCYYEAANSQYLDAIFKEILNNGDVKLVE